MNVTALDLRTSGVIEGHGEKNRIFDPRETIL